MSGRALGNAMRFFDNSGMQIRSLRSFGCDFCAFSSQVPITRAHAIEGENLAATARRFRFRAEIELDRFPRVSSLCLQSQRRSRLVTAMHHAVLTSAVARYAVDDAIAVPFGLFSNSA